MADDEAQDLDRFLRHLFLRGLVMPDQGGGIDALISTLKSSGALKSAHLEEAFRKIRREHFVTPEMKDQAYRDTPLRLAKLGFNISAPHMHAMCLESMCIVPGDAILDIGSGSGYLTAVASYLTGPTGIVHGVDLYDHIIEFSEANLKKLGPGFDFSNLTFIKRNCFLPAPEPIKYNRIHVGCCCPESKIFYLYDLLLPGGVLVTPYGDELLKATKNPDGTITQDILAQVRYSDLLLPSDAEVKEAFKAIEIAKAQKITVPETPQGNFSNLINSKFHSDISFCFADAPPIPSHRIFLALHSDYFYKLFSNEESSPKEIPISECTSEAFLEILHFVYGSTRPLNPKFFNQIYPIVVKFEIKELQSKIESYRSKLPVISIVPSNQPEKEIELPPFEFPPPDVPSMLEKFVGDPVCSDVIFNLGNDTLKGHKIILSQIDYFKHMFSSGLRESRSKEIKIFDCSVALFKDVLTYIYTGKCNVTDSSCEGLLEQANFFQLNRLTALCEQFWYKNINVENAGTVLAITDRFNALQLKTFTMEFIFKNVREVVMTNAWKSLDVDLVSQVLVAAVDRAQ